jgi:hypothetical protein
MSGYLTEVALHLAHSLLKAVDLFRKTDFREQALPAPLAANRLTASEEWDR